MKQDELIRNFTYHPPTAEKAIIYETLRGTALNLALLINDTCPESREKSLALTKLEECVMWTNASIARN